MINSFSGLVLIEVTWAERRNRSPSEKNGLSSEKSRLCTRVEGLRATVEYAVDMRSKVQYIQDLIYVLDSLFAAVPEHTRFSLRGNVFSMEQNSRMDG